MRTHRCLRLIVLVSSSWSFRFAPHASAVDDDGDAYASYSAAEQAHCARAAPDWAKYDPVTAWALSRVTFDHAVDHLVGLAESDTDITGLDETIALGGSGEFQELSASAEGTCVANIETGDDAAAAVNWSFPILTADFGRALKPPPWHPLTATLRVISDPCVGNGDGEIEVAVVEKNDDDDDGGEKWVSEVVLLDRGGCSFGDKALRVQRTFGSAVGMLVVNYKVCFTVSTPAHPKFANSRTAAAGRTSGAYACYGRCCSGSRALCGHGVA